MIHRSAMRPWWSLLGTVPLILGLAPSWAAPFPPGDYAVTLSPQDLPVALTNRTGSLRGLWLISFRPDGQFTVTRNGAAMVAGEYAAEGDIVRIGDETGLAACTPQGHGAGVYTWSTDGEGLIFTAVEDSCTGRRAVQTSRPWEAVSP